MPDPTPPESSGEQMPRTLYWEALPCFGHSQIHEFPFRLRGVHHENDLAPRFRPAVM